MDARIPHLIRSRWSEPGVLPSRTILTPEEMKRYFPTALVATPRWPASDPTYSVTDVANGTRECRTCGEIKPLTEFVKNATSPMGRAYICRECKRQKSRLEYRRIRDAIRAKRGAA